MNTSASDEDKARMVLTAYQHYAVPEGQTLLQQNISTHAWNNGWSTADVNKGLHYARDKGWIVGSDDGSIMLTSSGAAVIEALPAERLATTVGR